jgi:hypothetical protein
VAAIQLWLNRFSGKQEIGLLTKLYFRLALLAAVCMIVVEVSKNGSWNDLAVGSAAVWIFFYTIRLAIATLNVILLLLVLIDRWSRLKPDESKPLRI